MGDFENVKSRPWFYCYLLSEGQIKALTPLTFVRGPDGVLVPFHPSWNHWNYLNAESCSDSEQDLSGWVPGDRPLDSQPYCHRACALGSPLPLSKLLGDVPVFLFCIWTEAFAKLTPRQTFYNRTPGNSGRHHGLEWAKAPYHESGSL